MTLTHQDRAFFKLIQQAIFTNPFSNTWSEVVSEITKSAISKDNNDRLALLENTVEKQLGRLQAKGIDHNNLSTADKKLYNYGVQFLLFHRFASKLDDHIKKQIKSGPIPVIFDQAEEIAKTLRQYGFTAAATNHTIALFFQMRRSFYFINEIIGKSDSIQKLRRDLWRLIFTDDINLYEKHLWNRMEDFSTLILGETGSGKGLAARAIGHSGFIPFDLATKKFSISFTQGFTPLNLNLISPHLLESELFGHVKGSFTGATKDHTGVFARCSSHGSIFLDEIGETSTQIQVKLLQILQERIFTPVGSTTPKHFTGRVIAATNRDIATMRKNKQFREDFYYRLCTDTITIPSLAQRFKEEPQELGMLVNIVLHKILGKKDNSLLKKITFTINKLAPKGYIWPGNVRELEQCVRRILLKGRCEFEHHVNQQHSFNLNTHMPVNELLKQYCCNLYKQFNTYEAVARITHLDRRTVKRYINP